MDNLFSPAICTQCGAKLSVDAALDAAICNYCGTPYIVKQAIQKYNVLINGTINIENAIISNGPTAENYIKRGIQYENDGNTEMAIEYYNKALDIDADSVDATNRLTRMLDNKVISEIRGIETSDGLLHATSVLKERIKQYPRSKRLLEELILYNKKLSSAVFFQHEAFYKFRLLQLNATKGTLKLTMDKLIFESTDGSIEVQVDCINDIQATENGNYVGERIGRTKPNCIAVSYNHNNKENELDIRIHGASEIADTLDALVRELKLVKLELDLIL